VGQNVTGSFVFSKTGTKISESHGGYNWTSELGDTVTFKGTLQAGYGSDDHLAPAKLENSPPLTSLEGNSYTTPASGLRCVKVGNTFVGYFIVLDFTEISVFEGSGAQDPDDQSSNIFVSGPRFNCIADTTGSTTGTETGVTDGGDTIITDGSETEITVGEDVVVEEEPKSPIIEMSFSHVQPGEYSEVYLSVSSDPGTKIKASLGGPSVQGPETQEIVTDDNGTAYFVWKIYQFGQYNATIVVGDADSKYPWHRSVNVN